MKWGLPWGTGSTWGVGSAAEYGTALLGLLPRGVIWTDDPARKLSLLLAGFGVELARVHNRLLDLVEESDPRTVNDTIGDWERVFGLPDPCDTTPPTTIAGRRVALHARVIETGGSSIAYFVEVALTLGFVITITETPYGVPFRAGIQRCGERLSAVGNVFYWQVNAPIAMTAAERVRLECTFARIKPAHTVAVYVYA